MPDTHEYIIELHQLEHSLIEIKKKMHATLFKICLLIFVFYIAFSYSMMKLKYPISYFGVILTVTIAGYFFYRLYKRLKGLECKYEKLLVTFNKLLYLVKQALNNNLLFFRRE